MKASNYQRRHEGPLANAVLRALMTYHGCIHHAGANSGACLADYKRTDLVLDAVAASLPDAMSRHVLARWSDNTYGCPSCADAYERKSTRETFDLATYMGFSKPNWTYREALDHVLQDVLP